MAPASQACLAVVKPAGVDVVVAGVVVVDGAVVVVVDAVVVLTDEVEGAVVPWFEFEP